MDELERDLLLLINDLLTKDVAEIPAILKAKKLESSFDYLLLLVQGRLEERKQHLEMIFGFNPHQRPTFVRDNLESTGYPALLRILQNLIRARDAEMQRQTYWKNVELQFEKYKKSFEKTYNQSDNKARLIRVEISKYEMVFFPEKLTLKQINNVDTPIEGLKFRSFEISEFRSLYQKLIVNGEREYHLTSIPGSSIVITGAADSYHLKVEALAKYLDWLVEFDKIESKHMEAPVSRKFYLPQDFENLTNALLTVEPFRVKDLLDYHFGLSSESEFNWPQALRKFLLMDKGFVEPKNIGEIGFTIDSESKTPDQINRAYMWIRNKLNAIGKEVHARWNPELKRVEDITESDYAEICAKFERLKNEKREAKAGEAKELVEFRDTYISLLSKQKKAYEDQLTLARKSKPTIRQIVLGYFYNDRVIEKEKRHEIAKVHGFKGDPLYNTYLKVHEDYNRQRGTKRNIKDLRLVIQKLAGKAKKRAEADLREAEEELDQK